MITITQNSSIYNSNNQKEDSSFLRKTTLEGVGYRGVILKYKCDLAHHLYREIFKIIVNNIFKNLYIIITYQSKSVMCIKDILYTHISMI